MSDKKKISQKLEIEPRALISGINCWCRFDAQADVVNLIENPRNPNKHPDKQIALLAKIIRHQGWRQPITVSKRSGFIVKGHGRLAAAKMLNVENVPVEYQDYENEAAEMADLLADNRIAELSESDENMIGELLRDEVLFDGFDIDLTGWDGESIGELSNDESANPEDSTYTNKIIAPVYTPKGEKPPISALIDRTKTEQLIAGINAADMPEEIKQFMRYSAERHTVFNFRQIAEFYCHADPILQDLMERSGMIIIDFKKAIEYGFVHLTERLGALADLEEGSEADDGNA